MRTNQFSFIRSAKTRRPQPRRWVAVGEKEHYDCTSAADYREFLTVQQMTNR